MSTDGAVAPHRELGEYIAELVTRLVVAEPAAFRELRTTVGQRRARITLDDETVTVAFAGDRLLIEPLAEGPVEGEGGTDGHCVADLLDGYDEVSRAVLGDRLRVRGCVDDVAAMFAAIEILLDVSARSPVLQSLRRDLRADPGRPPRPPRLPGDARAEAHWKPGTVTGEEARLLSRLDLLPDDRQGSSRPTNG